MADLHPRQRSNNEFPAYEHQRQPSSWSSPYVRSSASPISPPARAPWWPSSEFRFQHPNLQQAFAGGPWLQARNFAVMTGANACISSVMKRIRGVEDVQSSMVSAFGSGALFSLVSGMGGGAVGNANPGVSALTTGLFFAFLQGGLFTFGQKFGQPSADDAFYYRTRSMLLNLGLQKYEKNFKRGLLTDKTLPLLTDSALRDVRIPPGPRLLILDHIQRDEDLANERR